MTSSLNSNFGLKWRKNCNTNAEFKTMIKTKSEETVEIVLRSRCVYDTCSVPRSDLNLLVHILLAPSLYVIMYYLILFQLSFSMYVGLIWFLLLPINHCGHEKPKRISLTVVHERQNKTRYKGYISLIQFLWFVYYI